MDFDVQSLSIDDLQDILANDDKLDEFIDSIPCYKDMQEKINQLSEENITLSDQNLEFQKLFESLRESVLGKAQELAVCHNDFEKLTSEHQMLSEKLSPQSLLQNMMETATISEEEGEKAAHKFLENELSVDNFMEEFLAEKKKYYTRHSLGTRLKKQLDKLQKAGF